MITMTGTPREWRTKQTRWQCRHCGSEGWSTHASASIGHGRPDGRVCRKSFPEPGTDEHEDWKRAQDGE